MKLPTSTELGFDSEATEFVFLKDGQHISGVIVGDPIFYRQIWNKGEEKQILPISNTKGSKRFRFNFLTWKNDAWVPMILENGPRLYAQIEEENSMRPIEHSVVKISRKGSGFSDTSYDLRFVQEVPAEKRAELAAVQLLDLDPTPKAKQNEAPPHTDSDREQPSFTEDDIPF